MAKDGRVIEKIGHDECGSSDALAVYEKEDGKVDGFCWSCGTYVPDPYGDGEQEPKTMGKRQKTDEEKQQDVVNIYNNFPVRALDDRGISISTAQYFDVRSAVDQTTGQQITHHYYPIYNDQDQLVAYKCRGVADKKFWHYGFPKNTQLFGEFQAKHSGAKKLIITEGECDAMAVFQCLKEMSKGTEFENYMPAVVSIKEGAKRGDQGPEHVAEEIGARQKFLSQFQEFIIVFDQDEPGRASAEAVAKLFHPGTAKIAQLPMKDPNEMLQAGKLQELKKAIIFNAQDYKPANIKRVSDVIEDAKKPTQWGMHWPWPTLTRLTYGIRRGEIIGVGAGVGCGKTTFWHQLEEWVALNQGQKIGLFMLEEPPRKTLKKLAGKYMGVDLNNPEASYDEAQVEHVMQALEPYLYMFDHSEDRSWPTVKEHIRHLVLVDGVRDIIIDPITALTYQFDASRTNDELNKIFGEVSAMAESLQFTLYYSSHLNPPETGKPHEEGGRVKAAQFTGSRAMIKWSHYILGLERDTQAQDITERNTVTCRILKDREYGNTGNFQIVYYPQTGQFIEPAPTQYATTGASY